MSRDDFANPNDTTADDNEEPRENSTNEEDKQSEEYVGILSRSIEGSNKVHNNHLRQCGFGVVTMSWKSGRMRIFAPNTPFYRLN